MTNKYFPFHAIGLQCNPFRTLTEDEWSELVVLPADCLSLLKDSEDHVQVIGDAGWGKSSMLRGIRRWCSERGIGVGFEYLPFGVNSFQSEPHTYEVFLLDEAQRLHRKELQRFLHAGDTGTRLIWSSHKDLVDPPIPPQMGIVSLHLDGYTQKDLARILKTRIEAFTLEGRPLIAFSRSSLEFLERRHGANLRGMFEFLYEFFQTIPSMKIISAEELGGSEESSRFLKPPG